MGPSHIKSYLQGIQSVLNIEGATSAGLSVRLVVREDFVTVLRQCQPSVFMSVQR